MTKMKTKIMIHMKMKMLMMMNMMVMTERRAPSVLDSHVVPTAHEAMRASRGISAHLQDPGSGFLFLASPEARNKNE